MEAGVGSESPLLLFCFLKQPPNVGLALSNIPGIRKLVDIENITWDSLVQDLRAIDNLGLPGVEHLADLSGHQSLACAGRPVQQDPLDVLTAQLLHDLWRKYAGGECSSAR